MEGIAGNIQIVSRRLVQPEPASSSPDVMLPPSEPETMHLTPWDLQYISLDYIQKGVLLPKPAQTPSGSLADDLASSFARALGRFYPLAGRLVVTKALGGGASGSSTSTCLAVSLCCNNKGAEFVHAVAPDIHVSDVTGQLYHPPVLQSFFPLNGLLCCDAMLQPQHHPVLAAQVTELDDGVFVAMSLNHAVADGTAFWHFFNTWSEISRSGADGLKLSTPQPALERWFADACPVPVTLPFSRVEDIIRRVELPPVRECFLHFSAESVRKLKEKANAKMVGTAGGAMAISSLQAVLAHLWRAACQARGLPPDHETTCLQPIGCRGRVKGVPEHYLGSAVALGVVKSTVARVLDGGLGGTAWLLNHAVASFDETETMHALTSWHRNPHILYLETSGGDPADVVVAASPRFDVYGNDFGWGKPATVWSGGANKMDSVVTVYEGRDGGDSMGMEVCMSPAALARLVADSEFMEAVTTA